MMSAPFFVVPFMAGLLISVAPPSEPSTAKAEPGPRNPVDAPRTEAPSAQEVTASEAKEFARTMEKAIQEGDEKAFAGLIDWDAVLETAMAGVEAPDQVRGEFGRLVKTSVREKDGLVPHIVGSGRKRGAYKLLMIHKDKSRTRALFRMITPEDGGVNYHDYVLEHRAEGKTRAVDLFNFLSGELISRNFHRSFVAAAAAGSPERLARLSAEERQFIESLPKMTRMTDELHAGKAKEALATYSELPAAVQKQKNVLLLRLRAARLLGEKEYAKAIEEFRKDHPDDPCIDILSIDGYVAQKQYDEALACVDRLDKAVGGDPYLGVLRAGINLGREHYDAAKREVVKAIERDPSLIDAYWTLVTITLRQKDYPETLRILKLIDLRFELTFPDMTMLSEYAAFVKSPQYQEWLAYQKSKKNEKAASTR